MLKSVPHLHIIATDGCFAENGIFLKGQHPNPQDLEDLFRYQFNWDVDDYGKTITHKIKCINEETAVLMIISGRKFRFPP